MEQNPKEPSSIGQTDTRRRIRPRGIKVLRLPSLTDRVGLATATIYDKLDPKSPRHDPTFPLPVSLGQRAVGWVEEEIDGWLLARIEQRQFNLNRSAKSDCEGGNHA